MIQEISVLHNLSEYYLDNHFKKSWALNYSAKFNDTAILGGSQVGERLIIVGVISPRKIFYDH